MMLIEDFSLDGVRSLVPAVPGREADYPSPDPLANFRPSRPRYVICREVDCLRIAKESKGDNFVLFAEPRTLFPSYSTRVSPRAAAENLRSTAELMPPDRSLPSKYPTERERGIEGQPLPTAPRTIESK